MSTKKNVLLIITDQHRADHLGCYGNTVVRTPNIDALASKGTRFDKFYVATPICMPNRATLMTGRMPSLHGVRHNGIPLSLDATTFVEVLRESGYHTALVGKSHLQNISGKPIKMGLPDPEPDLKVPPADLREARRGDLNRAIYNQELPKAWVDDSFDLTLPFYGFDHVSLVVGHGDGVTGHYRRWLHERHPDPEKLIGPHNAFPTETACPQAWKTRVPEELYSTSYIADEACRLLGEYANSESPFFLQCSFPDPHHPFTPPGRYWDMYDPNDVDLPEAFHHPEAEIPPHLAALHADLQAGRADATGNTVAGVTDQQARAAIALTYGSITMIDDAIGRILATMTALGLDDDTLVIFTSDHGDMMGDHKLLLKGALHYQGLVRVPCIWADPFRPNAPASTANLCGTLDLAPSILNFAGITPVNGMQGENLSKIASEVCERQMVIEDNPRRAYMGLPSNFVVRTLMTNRWRLSLYSDVTWGELYDLETDPCEFHNLWHEEEHSELRTILIEQLLRTMMSLSDRSPLATGHGP